MKTVNGFKVGSGISVKYPIGGTGNFLKTRLGKIAKVGNNKKGNGWIFIRYEDKNNKRIATLSVSRMVDPIVW